MGHYIGDGSQPLHGRIHDDGWEGPNPNGYTRDPKVHGRFESQYVDAISFLEEDTLSRIGKPSQLKGDVFDLIMTHLDEAGSNAEMISKLYKNNACADLND